MTLPEQARAYLHWLRSLKEPTTLTVLGRGYEILPGVFLPGAAVLEFFLETLPVEKGQTVLEIGTGHGILPILLYERHGVRVVATDLAQAAVLCARRNVEARGLGEAIDVRHGDLFSCLRPDERFDLVFWYAPLFGEEPKDELEMAITSKGHEAIGRYLAEGRRWLRTGGTLAIGFADHALEVGILEGLIRDHRYRIRDRRKLDRGGRDPLLLLLDP